jgi:opacity protein-like surface antigen
MTGPRTLIAALLAAALLTAPSRAEAGRAYLSGQAGMFLPLESSVTLEPAGLQGRLAYDPGVVLSAAGGYEFGPGFRAEGELNYRRVTADRFYGSGATQQQAAADIWSCGVMANAYYDLRTPSAVTPFLGAGLGFALAQFGDGTSPTGRLWTSGRELSPAYQGIAGFSVALSDRTSLDFVYRHYGTPTLHFETIHSQYKGINLSTGIRYWF